MNEHKDRKNNPYYNYSHWDIEDDYSEDSNANSVVNDWMEHVPKGILLDEKQRNRK